MLNHVDLPRGFAECARVLKPGGSFVAFDPNRKGVLLVAGDKKGANQDRFYKTLIRTADERYTAHLEALERLKKKESRK